ncbi:TolC family protein [Rhizosphaericola mali]|uniref:TolC family protein n=1 Tax=Rhizosphaericola mali TaxID=2545455 RepID=A0A5P2G2R6_9BACT|nr:TolC family protein [Rhizosphaericola mali]QES89008.1 TolC family protein [Rhizosphaericola mali]
MHKIFLISCCTFFVFAFNLFGKIDAQSISTDTVSLNIDSLESRFVRNNLDLLASRYNVDIQKAQIIQAKLFPNPNVSLQQVAYNQYSKSVLPFSKNGEFVGQVSQLIQLAGKRNKSVKLAAANANLSEIQFQDLLRTLKYTLQSDFYNLYYLQQSSKAYNTEITSLQNLVKAFDTQKGNGYISEKEIVRVRAQLYSILSEYNDLLNNMNDLQSEMRVIIAQPRINLVPVVSDEIIGRYSPTTYSLQAFMDSAMNNRTDLKIAKANTNINNLNLNYQKALAVPDLTALFNYDQQGGYLIHQYQVGVSMDLPFFSRNQGNIKAAHRSIDMSKVTESSTTLNIQETVYRALQKSLDVDKMYQKVDTSFEGDFKRLQNQVLINYQKRNLGLLDFLDFYESYKENILNMNQLRYERIQSFVDLNYYTATNFFQ